MKRFLPLKMTVISDYGSIGYPSAARLLRHASDLSCGIETGGCDYEFKGSGWISRPMPWNTLALQTIATILQT